MNVFQTTSNFNHNNYYYNQPNHNSPISSSSSASSVYSGQLVEENFYTNLDNTNNSLIHMFINNEQKIDQNLVSSSNQMFGSPSSTCSFNSSNGHLNWTPVSQTVQEEEVVLCQLDELTKNLNKKNFDKKMDYELSDVSNNIDQKRINNYDYNSNMFHKSNINNDCHYDTFNYNYQPVNNQVNSHLDLHQQHSPNTIHQIQINSPNTIHQQNPLSNRQQIQQHSPNNIHQIQQHSPNTNQLPIHFVNDSNNKKIMNSNQITTNQSFDQANIHDLSQSNTLQNNNVNYLKNNCVSASVNTLNTKIINSNQTISISNIKTTIKCQKNGQILNTDTCSINLKTDLDKSLNELSPNAIIGYDSEGRPIRNTANKKERRRTLSINNAFSNLRDCIPNVPADTKLSKIKTLRLATCYITYLMNLLNDTSPLNLTCEDFKVDLQRFKGRSKNINLIYPKISDKPYSRKTQSINCEFRTTQCLYSNQQLNITNHYNQISKNQEQNKNLNEDKTNSSVQLFNQCSNIEQYQQPNKRLKGRTGWPQYVWASELQQNQN